MMVVGANIIINESVICYNDMLCLVCYMKSKSYPSCPSKLHSTKRSMMLPYHTKTEIYKALGIKIN